MHKLAYTLAIGVAFWIGQLHQEASKPVQPFKIVRPQPQLTPALTPICENLTEIRRACFAQKRSSLIQQIKPNRKGKL